MSSILKFRCELPYRYNVWSRSKSVTRKLQFLKKCSTRGLLNQSSGYNFSTNVHNEGDSGNSGPRTFVKFENLVERRRKEALRSILVQVHSQQSCYELYEYCNSLGPVRVLYHYCLNDNNHFVLVEFNEEHVKDDILRKGTHLDRSRCVPVVSPMLWFRAKSKSNKNRQITSQTQTNVPVFTYSAADSFQYESLLESAESMSDQMRILHEATRLNEVGTRLRYLTAHQLEGALAGLFPNCKALPFGSSVNGFGKLGCDLDLVFIYDDSEIDGESRLIFQSKGIGSGGRVQTQRQMEAIGDLIHLYLPGCSSVKRILQARVPIVKYTQEMTNVDCDLSMTNMSAVYMSELLYLFGEADLRVRPLVFTIKKWAQSVGLTNPTPGRWMTNFSLTLLIIFYLQRVGVLPSVDLLVKMARAEDVRFADDINCTYLRDLSNLKLTPNTSTLAELLRGFFEFYTNFDFAMNGISICSGKPIIKPDYSALYIVNPLERSLNVSKNVSPEETERLRIEMRNAVWNLDTNCENLLVVFSSSLSPSRQQTDISFFRRHHQPTSRLVTVKDLFTESR